ncbi:MAG: DUF2244 domain-containing protein [Proteobacteria bacterium]|nr:MAG: DUF2244 domain-containing protein [Pseudomonadota bacterium]
MMSAAAAEPIELAPRCSLTPAQARGFFLATCAAAFTIAGALALAGYWPVLPFAGLEMAVLGMALRLSMRRREQGQRILVSDEEVRIESRGIRGCRSVVVFPRHWAQVKLRKAHVRSHPSRLTIESMGRSCEVGPFLTEEDRRGLAGRLAGLIGKVSESPPLP